MRTSRARTFRAATCLLAATPVLAPAIASAQTSVTLSGVIDGGITYVNNQHGGTVTLLDSGILAPNMLTFKGTEDLGGGTRALFELTNQFDIGDGTVIPGPGALFNRTALVGLSSSRFGSLTLGTQYDFMFESLTLHHFDGAFLFGGLYDFRQGPFTGLGVPNNPTGAFDFDRMAGATRVGNSVKYRSPAFGGFSFGGLYGFGEQPGSFSTASTVSAGANYDDGPFAIGAAYVDVKYPQFNNGHDGIRNFGVGAHYQFPSVLAMLLYTNTKNTATGAKVDVYKAGVLWNIAGPWATGLDYTFMKGNEALQDNKAHQVTAAVQYRFSKRTTAYLEGVYQRASGDGEVTRAWINGLIQPDGAASNRSQTLGRIGLRHAF